MAGRVFPLRFVLDGPPGPLDGVVRHNLDLLAHWAEAVGAGASTDAITWLSGWAAPAAAGG